MLFVKRLAHIRQLFLEALLETVLDAALLTGRHTPVTKPRTLPSPDNRPAPHQEPYPAGKPSLCRFRQLPADIGQPFQIGVIGFHLSLDLRHLILGHVPKPFLP